MGGIGGESCLVTVAEKRMWEGCREPESRMGLPWRPRFHTVLQDLAQDGRAQSASKGLYSNYIITRTQYAYTPIYTYTYTPMNTLVNLVLRIRVYKYQKTHCVFDCEGEIRRFFLF